MWQTNSTFNKVDSRLQESKYVSKMWKKEMDKQQYQHASNIFWNTWPKM
ncbi:hypothetical protein [Pontimicrobium sp. MEBiC06410]